MERALDSMSRDHKSKWIQITLLEVKLTRFPDCLGIRRNEELRMLAHLCLSNSVDGGNIY